MSAGAPAVPYYAPWASAFTRYSVQRYPATAGSTSFRWQVPKGQWWRVIAIFCFIETSSTAGTRGSFIEFEDSGSDTLYSGAVGGTFGASVTANFTYGPGLSGIFVSPTSSTCYGSAPISDMLWPQSTQVGVFIANQQAGDVFTTNTGVFVEVYVQGDQGGGFVPAAPTIPLAV